MVFSPECIWEPYRAYGLVTAHLRELVTAQKERAERHIPVTAGCGNVDRWGTQRLRERAACSNGYHADPTTPER